MNLNSLNIKCAIQSTRIEFQWTAAALQSGSDCTYNVKVMDGTKMQTVMELSTRGTRASVDLEPNNSYMVAVESLVNGRSVSASAMHFKLGDLPIFCGEYCTTMAVNEQLNPKIGGLGAAASFSTGDKIFDQSLAGVGHVIQTNAPIKDSHYNFSAATAIGPSLSAVTLEPQRKDRYYHDHVISGSRDKTAESRDRRVESRDRRAESRDRRMQSRDRRIESRDRRIESRDRRMESRDRGSEGRDRSRDRHFEPRGRRSASRDHPNREHYPGRYESPGPERKPPAGHWRDAAGSEPRYNERPYNERNLYARRLSSRERSRRRDESPESEKSDWRRREKRSREREFLSPSNENKHSGDVLLAEIGQADWSVPRDQEQMMTSSTAYSPLPGNHPYAVSAGPLILPPVVSLGETPVGMIPPDFLVPQNLLPQNPAAAPIFNPGNDGIGHFEFDVQASRDPYNGSRDSYRVSRDLDSSRRESRDSRLTPAWDDYRHSENYDRKSRDREIVSRDYDVGRRSRDDYDRQSRDFDRRSRDYEPVRSRDYY